MARQKLMTKELLNQVPELYEQDGMGDNAIVFAHYFCPTSRWDWYLMEYSREYREGYGYVCGFANELGYFSFDEFEQMNDKFFNNPHPTFSQPWIERELYFDKCTLGELKKSLGLVA